MPHTAELVAPPDERANSAGMSASLTPRHCRTSPPANCCMTHPSHHLDALLEALNMKNIVRIADKGDREWWKQRPKRTDEFSARFFEPVRQVVRSTCCTDTNNTVFCNLSFFQAKVAKKPPLMRKCRHFFSVPVVKVGALLHSPTLHQLSGKHRKNRPQSRPQ